MSYIGLPPKATFSSGLLDRFTSTTGTTVTLTHDIASENDIVVFVNFVKQDSTTYSVGGTGNKTLTLGGTLVSSDIVEVHYLNIVGQTVNPSANSVGSSQLTADSITGQSAETSIATDDTILIHDTSASALKKMTRANFVSGIGGTNTPNFYVNRSGTQTVSAETWTKVQLNSEVYDSSSAFDSSTNYRFTVPSGQGGKYFFQGSVYGYSGDNNLQRIHIRLYKNGSSIVVFSENDWTNQAYRNAEMKSSSAVLSLSAGDYIELYVKLFSGGGTPTIEGPPTRLSGFKIIE
nr:c1q globular head like domain containing protein [uncultured Mediterranean phage uvMED]BAR38291.1 c1q globular head like domain containing protein [uncultured Mediterranean phage uvMED]